MPKNPQILIPVKDLAVLLSPLSVKSKMTLHVERLLSVLLFCSLCMWQKPIFHILLCVLLYAICVPLKCNESVKSSINM